MRFAILTVLTALALSSPAPAHADTLGATQMHEAVLSQAPVTAIVPHADPAPIITGVGIAGFSWGQIVGYAMLALAGLFGSIKGGKYLSAWTRWRKFGDDILTAAYLVVEKDFGDLPGAAKYAMAIGKAYELMEGHSIPLSLDIGAQADVHFAKMAADPLNDAEPKPNEPKVNIAEVGDMLNKALSERDALQVQLAQVTAQRDERENPGCVALTPSAAPADPPKPASSIEGAVAKALVLLALAAGLLWSSPARAQVTLDYGPAAGFMLVTSTATSPTTVAPKAGYQISLSEEHLNLALLGKSYDMLSAQVMALGTLLPGVGESSKVFGALALGGMLCTLNGMICGGVIKDVVDTNGGFLAMRAGWMPAFSLCINFGLAPAAPPTGVETGARGLVRGNTLWLGAY